MGILQRPMDFVHQVLDAVPGADVLELGDQWLTFTDPHQLAMDVYKRLGCGQYVSVDANGRGTHTLDLNLPLPQEFHSAFDLVTDFGTGEHVFNQHQVWKTLHDSCRVGGYVAFDRPMQGYPTHCFYLIDECLIRDLAAANDYEVLELETAVTKRGSLVRGLLRRTRKGKFLVPYQGRYQKSRAL